MAAKKPKSLPSDEEQEMQEIEDKVKQMLDPSVPDPEPPKPAFEVIKENDVEPTSAPEVEGVPTKLPVSIQIKDGNEEDSGSKEPVPQAPAKKGGQKKAIEISTPEENETPKSKPITVTDASSEETPAEKEPEETTPDSPEENDSPEPITDESEAPAEEAEAAEEPEGQPVVEEPEEPLLDDTDVDSETAKAVDDIVEKESDQLLEAEDKEISKAFEHKKPSFFGRFRNFLSVWWHNRLARRATIAVLLLGLVAAMTVPHSRYFVLNVAGVRSAASVKVLDESTRQPLKNVQVSLRGQSALTDDDGVARLNNLKLGTAELSVEKRAFAPVKQQVTLGWGSNPLGEKGLAPVGSQYAFKINDFLSGKPIQKVEAVSGDASAFSNEEGLIKLTIDKTDEAPVDVVLKADGLREEKLTLEVNDKAEKPVQMVPAREHIFITKRSGKYDVYKIYVDGAGEGLVLAGTGNERDDMVLAPHPKDGLVALVSTRTGDRNGDGYLLSTLTLIDLSDNSTVEVAKSERVQIVDWSGDKLVYVRIVAGTSAADPKRHRMMTYDTSTNESKELASSNYFNDIMMARGSIYYAPSSLYQTANVELYKVNADGSDKKTVIDKETWNIFRNSYHTLTLAIGQDWYEYNLGNGTSNKLPGEPANLRSRSYADSPDSGQSLWVDQRDGKGVLLAYDLDQNNDKEIHQRSGLKTPVRWLNKRSVVFRIGTDQETADYAVSLEGGEPKKIRDVTNTASIDDWYYY